MLDVVAIESSQKCCIWSTGNVVWTSFDCWNIKMAVTGWLKWLEPDRWDVWGRCKWESVSGLEKIMIFEKKADFFYLDQIFLI